MGFHTSTGYQMAALAFDAESVPAGVILCGVAIAERRHMLAKELASGNAKYLQNVLDHNPDYAGFTLGSIAYVIAKRLYPFSAQ